MRLVPSHLWGSSTTSSLLNPARLSSPSGKLISSLREPILSTSDGSNTPTLAQATMTPETTMAQSNGTSNGSGNGYTEAWANMSPYSQSPYNDSPMSEYNHWGGYVPHGLSSEPLNRMPPPPPQQQSGPPPAHQIIHPTPGPLAHHHQLPMLNTTWPSQLTNPTPPGSYSAPPLSMTPVSSAHASDTPRSAAPPDKSRKTLSLEQKRAMCQYSEDNPGVRQMDIGRKFGVERSTVSKVLRQKDQYLKREQEDPASAKKAKGRHPDFDRTLSNYVRRQQQRGVEVKDDEILKHAKLFARASDNHESVINSLSGTWLQKFKHKHGIGPGRLMRRASDTNIPDSARLSTVRSKPKREGSTTISPASPAGHMSPLSEGGSDEDMQPEGLGLDFAYRATASQSTASLTDDANNSFFSGGTMSPTGTFTFSPDPNTGGFSIDRHMHLGSNTGIDGHHREKRSNTFPSLNVESVNHPHSTDPMTPRHLSSTATSSSTIDSPAQDLQAHTFSIDTSLTSPPSLHRSSSNPSMATRPATTPVTSGGGSSGGMIASVSMDSSPVSPSQEDARRAANTLLNYIQSMSSNGQFDQGEYMTLVQLTKKLQMHQHQPPRTAMGGLSRIPEGDSEAPPTMISVDPNRERG